MKQLFCSLLDGSVSLVDIPLPSLNPNSVLVRTSSSLLSAGTERMLIDFGKANFIDKIKQQPDKVQTVLNKIRSDGLLSTLDAVNNQLDTPLPLGYCNVGTVVSVGKNVQSVRVGDRIASNGPHAEFVSVPFHLCSIIPDEVSDEAASFTVLASIGLQAIRLAKLLLAKLLSSVFLG